MAARIMVAVGLLLLGGVFGIVGLKSRPHKLKKEYISFVFRANLPHELEEPVAVLHSTKSELVATFFWTGMLVFCIVLLTRGQGSVLYPVASCGGMLYTLWLSTRKLLLYPNAVVHQSLTGRKVYFLDDLERIESYNIVNAFNRGVSYGYSLRQNGKEVLRLPKGSFKTIDRLEEVYRDSPYRKQESA